MTDQVTIIIRSVGERTETLCKKLILDQGVPEENVFVIRETPFSKAMRVGYQKGIDNGLKWTYCIDADVLMAEHAIRDMVRVANKQPDEVFTISARLVDKFFNFPRRVGNHLFRTSSLASMISNIAPYEKEGIRPETDAKNAIIEKGGIEHKIDDIIGLHDFEQHYEDIARKAYVHANKHTEYLGEFVPHWKENAAKDRDYKVALFGLSEGLKHVDNVKINKENYEVLVNQVRECFGEKSVETDIKNSNNVENRIELFKSQKKARLPHGYLEIYNMLKSKFKFDIKSLF